MNKHPADVFIASLLDGQLDDETVTEIRKHLGSCGFCKLRVGQSLPGQGLDAYRTVSSISTPVLPRLSEVEKRDELPQLGDVWRLVWEETNELGIIEALDSENQRVTVLPILFDVDLADEWCGLTTMNVADRKLEIAASVALATSVSWCVLDVQVGRVEHLGDLKNLRSEFKGVKNLVASSMARGNPILSIFDRRAEYISELGEAFHQLADADWGQNIPNSSPNQWKPDFDLLLTLQIPSERALALHRGQTPPSQQEVKLVEEQTGEKWLSIPSIPDALRAQLNHPQWRLAILQKTEEDQISEPEERVRIALALQEQVMAARSAHGSLDWRSALEHFLS